MSDCERSKRKKMASDPNRTERAAKRGKAWVPPVCTDRYCEGVLDPCGQCKLGATKPLSAPRQPVRRLAPRSSAPPLRNCCKCRVVRAELTIVANGKYICKKCDKATRTDHDTRRKNNIAAGRLCIVCASSWYTKVDGQKTAHDRWICIYCINRRDEANEASYKRLSVPKVVESKRDEVKYNDTIMGFAEAITDPTDEKGALASWCMSAPTVTFAAFAGLLKECGFTPERARDIVNSAVAATF